MSKTGNSANQAHKKQLREGRIVNVKKKRSVAAKRADRLARARKSAAKA